MKVGTINFATHSGLGILTKEFYDNGIVNDILVVKHETFTSHHEKWYPGAYSFNLWEKDNDRIENWIKGLDVLFLFETNFIGGIIELAKKYNVGVALMPMYECSPFPLDVDLYLVPSQIDYDYYKSIYPNKRIILLNVPAHSEIKWKLKEKALTFTHNAGNNKFADRNGTKLLIDSLPYIKSDCKIRIKSQVPIPGVNDPRVEIFDKDLPFKELWDTTDVFLFVERYNGLSLPIQESYASGCAVIAGNRYPINTWLPNKLLVNPTGYDQVKFPGGNGLPFNSAQYDPKDIAQKVDEIYGQDISKYSLSGKLWAESNSWKVLGPRYLDLLESICKK